MCVGCRCAAGSGRAVAEVMGRLAGSEVGSAAERGREGVAKDCGGCSGAGGGCGVMDEGVKFGWREGGCAGMEEGGIMRGMDAGGAPE